MSYENMVFVVIVFESQFAQLVIGVGLYNPTEAVERHF